jgi:Fe-S cluster assembly protein SufD
MSSIAYFKEEFTRLQKDRPDGQLDSLREKAFKAFNRLGVPTSKHEEWKYTRIGNLFNTRFAFQEEGSAPALTSSDIDAVRLPGHETANELIFVNGKFVQPLSTLRSPELVVLPLDEAARNEYSEIVGTHLGHSAKYLGDGINALNTAFIHDGLFIHVKKGKTVSHPVYIYNITDARSANILAQPRNLVHISEQAHLQLVETFHTLGQEASFTNQVVERIVEKDAIAEYYKIQNDASHANQVSTTHIRQVGKSNTHAVTISLGGGIVRNNMNIILEAAHSEAHLYGLYFQQGQSHVDNHTVVDNVSPNCFSNEFYKGILDDRSTGVFNGKIFVQPLAQKTNAFQSNKNILLSPNASVNTKPQLEIFADDVKCSHGCTIGKLDEEGLFYLRSRGISEDIARSLLINAFATDILEQVKPAAIRTYVEHLISKRLEVHSI